MLSNSSQKEIFKGYAIYGGKGPTERTLQQEGGYLVQPALFGVFDAFLARRTKNCNE